MSAKIFLLYWTHFCTN